jgi:hypothetical protein
MIADASGKGEGKKKDVSEILKSEINDLPTRAIVKYDRFGCYCHGGRSIYYI